MKGFINYWSEFVVNHRMVVIALSVIAIICGLFFGRDIPFDNSQERNFVEGDPDLITFEKSLDLFGDNEYLVIGFQARPDDKDIFEPETIQMVDQITRFLEEHEAVTQVRSISKYQYTHADGDTISTDDLFEDIDNLGQDPDALTAAREVMANEELALGTLITDDFQHTRIIARTLYSKTTAEHKVKLMLDLYDFVEKQGYKDRGYHLRYSGQPLFNEKFETHTIGDSAALQPVMALVMLVVLYISFRSFSAMLLPWLVIGAGVIVLSGIQGALGYPHSPVDTALIPTMIIIGVGISVHVLVEFFRFRSSGLMPPEASKATIVHLWKPGFYTSLTTAIGFFALSATKIVPTREMALLGGVGSLLLFLFALTLLPAVLSYIKGFSTKTEKVLGTGFVSVFTSAIPDITLRLKKPILAVGACSLIFAIVTAPQIRVDTNFVEYFKKDNPARIDMIYFDRLYKGAGNIEAMVDSGESGGIKDPRFLARVEQLQNYFEGLEETGDINSVIDYLKKVMQSLNGDDPAHYRLPDSKELVAQALFLYENSGPEEDLSDLKDFDERYLRLSIPFVNTHASELSKMLSKIEADLDDQFSDLDVRMTGTNVMLNTQDIYTNEGMFKSFTIALIVIGLCFVVLLRSVKYGVLAMIPSILPILITGGIATLANVNLDLGTMIVGAMTMGIAVDDSIHVMNRYLLAKKQGASTHDAIKRAMTESGRAVIFSSIVLVLGFGVLMFGELVPFVLIGLLGSCIMFLALLGDLFFLPALLYLVDKDDIGGRDEVKVDKDIGQLHKTQEEAAVL